MSHFHFSMYLCCIIQLLNMESLDTLLRCDCCWCSRLPGIPPTTTSTKRASARALLRTAVASSHAPLRTETLTSVYADLKGGAGQRGGGCRVRDRKGPNTPNTTKSFFLRRFLFFGKPRRRLELSLFTSTAGDVSL